MKIMEKINKRKISKLYMTIIKLSQSLGETEWQQEVETNKGNLNITIKLELPNKGV